MKKTKTEPLINKYIVGRVLPHIYAFKTNSVPNSLKVGDTYRPVSVRLNEWKKYYPNLQKEYEEKATVDNDTKFFRDYAVHDFLENDKQKKHLPPEGFPARYYSKEFFNNATVKDVKLAIEDINKNYGKTDRYQYYSMDRVPETFTYEREAVWDLRDNQKQAVENFVKAVNEKHRTNLLMYAVMRFGKSFTSLCCAKEIDAKLVLVVSAKADVKDEWKKNVEKPGNFNNFVFLDEQTLRNENAIHDVLEQGKVCVVFLTLQDLQGSKIKEKHEELFKNDVDLLIVDETHFGARADKYGEILRDKRDKRDTEDCISEKDEKALKELHPKVKLHLSGTPYRILMSDEFTQDDIICFCQYTDIIDEQKKWDEDHQEEDEWKNPYYGFPQMVRFAFNPNKSTQDKLEELRKNNITYAFSEFFKPLSITKTDNNLHKKFKYESEILEFLKVIDGSSSKEKLLGFLNYEQIKQGKMCRHMVCVLPYKASCDALENLIKTHKKIFKNLNEYEIINIAGVDNPVEYRNIESIKNKIKQCEEHNKKTLTLTVNRMLTGTTVPEWDTMLYFKDTASPQEYDQSIFRLQNQYVVNYKDKNGDKIKYNMKPQTLLVDFDPNRMFQMQEEKAKIYNVNVEKSGNTKLKERIEKELSISPIILLNTDKISEVKEADIMKVISEYSKDKGVADEVQSISVDLSLMKNAELMAEISKQPELGSKDGLSFKASDTDADGDDLDTGDEITQTSETETPTESEQAETQSSDKDTPEQKFIKQMQTYYARILFFAFLTKDKVVSLEDIIKQINTNDNNKRIAKNLGLKLKILKLLNKMNAFKLSDLDYKIQNLNTLANDKSVEPLERAKIAITKFARLSTSEIQTPAKICKEMVDLIPLKDYKKSINSGNKLLDIASKSGEFARALYEKLSKNCDKNKLKNAIYSIPTSTIAYEFTYKIYDVLGLNVKNIATAFTSYDLLNVKNANGIDYDKIKELLTQNKDFDKMTLDDEIKGGKKVKFDAIVGNPPYQQNLQNTSDKQLYNLFMEIAYVLSKHVVMITPSKFLYNAGKTPKDWNQKMLNDKHLKIIKEYSNAKDVFVSTSMSGGVVITFRNEDEVYSPIVFYAVDYKIQEIKDKVLLHDFKTIKDIIYLQNKLNLDEVYRDFPNLRTVHGEEKRIVSSAFVKLAQLFHDRPKSKNDIEIVGLINRSRISKYINKKYLVLNENLTGYKVIISAADGASGVINNDHPVRIIGKTHVLKKNVGFSQTFISIGAFSNQTEAENLEKYLKTKFARFMIGTLKATNGLKQEIWQNVPLQDFTNNSNIDWTQPIANIDQQLYDKYEMSPDERQYIEDRIKPME